DRRILDERETAAGKLRVQSSRGYMLPIVGTDVVFFSCLAGMPHMIQKFIRVPYFFLPVVGKPKSHFVGSANMTEIIDMLIGSADSDQIPPQSRHAGPVIARVQDIFGVPHSRGFPVRPVD